MAVVMIVTSKHHFELRLQVRTRWLEGPPRLSTSVRSGREAWALRRDVQAVKERR